MTNLEERLLNVDNLPTNLAPLSPRVSSQDINNNIPKLEKKITTFDLISDNNENKITKQYLLTKNPLNAWMAILLSNKNDNIDSSTRKQWFIVIYVTAFMQWLATAGIFASYKNKSKIVSEQKKKKQKIRKCSDTK